VGAYLSISIGNVPTGPVIVLVLFAIFLVSLLASPKRSIVVTALRRVRARQALRRELMAEEGTL
ncbi:MAG: metal ABC transporter permease, partial [Pseudomonadota bacterium]